jgi:hypothetical protein
MTPAKIVISKFGGVRATARALGLNASTVCQWDNEKERGGTGGVIPQKYFKTIMDTFPEVTLEQLCFGSH